MAGVKVTDLITLGTADPADVMYIVDSSSNQSKQIEVQNIYSGISQLEAGSYTPTVSDGTNGVIVTPFKAYYTKIDNIVNVSFLLDVQFDTGETSASFNLSLPVASNFGGDKEFIATIWYRDLSELLPDSYSASDSSNDKISVFLVSNTAAFNYSYLTITGQYEII
jgi:hypothetical protein